ncbi:unnamed protein product [Gongylonema pulchrum]|uniref:HCO3_cotransp domain-containing protein n=1 Tax=Gongylonema pulchrum TaxID=637853 RepID=A0A183CX89_9BILA|nr:unnamed protein product [Gongylonema pulchrum]
MIKALQVFLFPFLALITGLVLDATNQRIRFLRIPDTILIFLFALGTSFVLHLFFPEKLMAHIDETYTWKTVQPGIVVGVKH